MKLSVELFQKTVQQLKGESGGAEKRSHPRVGLRARIQLKLVKGGAVGAPIDVWTRDISRVGLGILSSRKLKIGEHYLLTLPHEDQEDPEKPLALFCTVRCWHELTPDIFAIGFSFEDMRLKQFPAARRKDKAEVESAMLASAGMTGGPTSSQDEDRIRKAILG